MLDYVLVALFFLVFMGGLVVTHGLVEAKMERLEAKPRRVTTKALDERKRHHAHVNAMERDLDIPESVWDDEEIAEPAPSASATVRATNAETGALRHIGPIPRSTICASTCGEFYSRSNLETVPRAGASPYFHWPQRVWSYGARITSHAMEIYTGTSTPWCVDTVDLDIGMDPGEAYDAIMELNRQSSGFYVMPKFTYGGQKVFGGGVRELQRMHDDYWRLQHLQNMHMTGLITTDMLRGHLGLPAPRSDPGHRGPY